MDQEKLMERETHGTVDRRYRLKRVVADDHTASVYVAEHVHTHREVVIKLPRKAETATLARMRREIEILARVRSPGVSEMLDAGEADGRPFIVLELLHGRSLAGLLAARGRLGILETVKVGVEMATVLGHCHAHGVTHRDVKPANVFVTNDVARQLRLLDFGIARLDSDGREAPKLTRDDAILGTPEYMAPEALLAASDVDCRADLYGLGVTLFECLTGTVPFEGNYSEILMKLSTTSARSVNELRSDVPPALANVVAKCLARSPSDRWADATEMADALRRAVHARLEDVDLLGHRAPPDPPARARTEATLADAPHAKATTDVAARRKFPRAAYLSLSRVTQHEGPNVDGRVEELSEGGLQFVGERAIDSGNTVSIRFALPSSGRITAVKATARWNRTFRGTNVTGFEFVDLADDARGEIRSYVSFMCADAPHPSPP